MTFAQVSTYTQLPFLHKLEDLVNCLKLCHWGDFHSYRLSGHLWVRWYCCHHLFSAFCHIQNRPTYEPSWEVMRDLPGDLRCWSVGEEEVLGKNWWASCGSVLPPLEASSWTPKSHFQFKIDCCWAHPILWLGEPDRIQIMMDSSGRMVIWCPVVCLFPEALEQDCKCILLSVQVSATIYDPLFW